LFYAINFTLNGENNNERWRIQYKQYKFIGADLLNIDKIKDLSAPIASIGGARTFDGIFLAGVISVLLV